MNQTILRNLFYTLKRFRTASFLNLLGLSAAFAAFIVIMMKTRYEQQFDTCYPEPERLAVLNLSIDGKDNELVVVPRPFVDAAIQETTGIECGTLLSMQFGSNLVYTDPHYPKYIKENVAAVYPDFAKTIGMTFVEGNDEGLDTPNGAIISESQAKRLFPDGSAIGKYIYLESPHQATEETQFRISGVYKEFPKNAQLTNDIYCRIGEKWDLNQWGSWSYLAFVRLKPRVTYEEVNRQLVQNKIINDKMEKSSDFKEVKPMVIPIRDVYYHTKPWFYFKTGDLQHTRLMILIAILVIGIAAVNLINFTTALTPMRIRSINTQKVLGSSVGSLRTGLVLEAVCTVLLGWLIALGIVACLTQTQALDALDFNPALKDYLPVIFGSVGIALLTGVLAGLYPAWYMTSFPPALMLKGNFALSGKGKRLRTALVSFQYFISACLIVCSTFIFLQNEYQKNIRTGFDRDMLLIAQMPQKPFLSQPYKAFDQQLLGYPEFEGVAYANDRMGGGNVYNIQGFTIAEQHVQPFYVRVSTNFPKVMGMKVTEGRDFLPGDSVGRNVRHYIATKEFKKMYNLPTGQELNADWMGKAEITGYVDNVAFTSNRITAFSGTPFVFTPNLYDDDVLPFGYIRVKAGSDPAQALSHAREAFEKSFPGYAAEIDFFDNVYKKLYTAETNQQQVVIAFSVLAILISLVGVFGLTIFETQYRRKEIGVRKVFGASTSQILWQFNRASLKVAILCSAVAMPVAYYVMNRWLESFTQRVPLSAWVFVAACLLIILMTLVTVTVQSYRAANSNPIDCVRAE